MKAFNNLVIPTSLSDLAKRSMSKPASVTSLFGACVVCYSFNVSDPRHVALSYSFRGRGCARMKLGSSDIWNEGDGVDDVAETELYSFFGDEMVGLGAILIAGSLGDRHFEA